MLKKKRQWAEKDLKHRDVLDNTASALLELCATIKRESLLLELILKKEYGITDEDLRIYATPMQNDNLSDYVSGSDIETESETDVMNLI